MHMSAFRPTLTIGDVRFRLLHIKRAAPGTKFTGTLSKQP